MVDVNDYEIKQDKIKICPDCSKCELHSKPSFNFLRKLWLLVGGGIILFVIVYFLVMYLYQFNEIHYNSKLNQKNIDLLLKHFNISVN